MVLKRAFNHVVSSCLFFQPSSGRATDMMSNGVPFPAPPPLGIAATIGCERPPRPIAPTPPVVAHLGQVDEELDEMKPVIPGGPEDDMVMPGDEEEEN